MEAILLVNGRMINTMALELITVFKSSKKMISLFSTLFPFLDVNGTFYKGYFRNGKKCGEGTLNNFLKRQTMKGIWIDGSCATSILQDDVLDENKISLKDCIPVVSKSKILCSLFSFEPVFADWPS